MLKESYLIKYSLFCSRKKFNLKKFLLTKKISGEEFQFNDFKQYLIEKMVCPPEKELFDLTLQEVEKELKEKLEKKFEEEEELKLEKEVIKEKKADRPKRVRRKKKK